MYTRSSVRPYQQQYMYSLTLARSLATVLYSQVKVKLVNKRGIYVRQFAYYYHRNTPEITRMYFNSQYCVNYRFDSKLLVYRTNMEQSTKIVGFVS